MKYYFFRAGEIGNKIATMPMTVEQIKQYLHDKKVFNCIQETTNSNHKGCIELTCWTQDFEPFGNGRVGDEGVDEEVYIAHEVDMAGYEIRRVA